MITTPSGQTITTPKDLWGILPLPLKQRLMGLWRIGQASEYHPEGNVLKHVITVLKRGIKSGDPDIMWAALFHDIGKDVTFAINSKGRPSAHGHENVSAELVKEYRKLIREYGGNPVVVYFLVKQHMRVKNIDVMRASKQRILRNNPNFNKLSTFKGIDRGGLHVEHVNETSVSEIMPIPDEIKKIADAFHNAGHKLYVVGGAIRDFLLGKHPKDYDLATDAVPDKSLEIIRKMGYRSLEVGKSFGVVIAIPPSGEQYEIATFRKDIGSGRRPDSVEFSDINTDVQRRDLTINAMFYDIHADKIVDIVGGRDDLASGTIRTVGNPSDRFAEDPLRKLRALRFHARIGKTIDPATLNALKSNSLDGVSSERIRDEFMKSVTSAQNPKQYMILMDRLGYLQHVVNGLQYSKNFINSRNPIVQIASIIADQPYDVIKSRLNALKYTNNEIHDILVMTELYKIVKNQDWDSIFRLWKGYSNANKNVVKEFAKNIGLIKYAIALDGLQLRSDDTKNIARQYSGPEIGEKMKEYIKTQFLSKIQEL